LFIILDFYSKKVGKILHRRLISYFVGSTQQYFPKHICGVRRI